MVCFQCMFDSFAYLSFAYILYRLFWSIYIIIYPYLIASPLDLHKLAGNAKWAIVTGSTDGIGKEYAKQLAQKGFNIILISRTQTKLDSVKDEIKKECKNVEIETIAYDFKNANLNDYKKEILSKIEEKDIGILVNNVGLAYECPDMLHKVDLQTNADICIVNTVGVSILTAAVLPQMVKRNSGIIVNISSGTAYMNIPYLSIYSSTKAYINHFTNILRSEYSDTNIIIQTVCPFYVKTNMSKVDETFFNLSPKKFVQSALKTIGIIDETTGCIQHQIQAVAFGLPQFISDYGMKFQTEVFKKKAAAFQREKSAKQK
jgi:17beta-estradiol 17-dehydrogenase / very-long-chain 3-oxoacyl-CoA reductase